MVGRRICEILILFASAKKWVGRARKPDDQIGVAQWFISAQAQMLLSEIQNSLKLALPYLTKRCLKYYLGREQSFDKGFRVQFSIFSEIGFENWQISA